MDVRGKVVVITGASSGLGAVVAEKLANERAKLFLTAQNEAKLQSVAARLRAKTEVYSVCVDITDEKAAETIVQTALSAYGRIDILVSNAGIWTNNELEAEDDSRIKQAFEVNSIGAIRLIKSVVPVMLKAKTGYIFAVVSTAGSQDTEAGDNQEWMTYGATKWALSGFLKALTKKVADSPIRVTNFMPGGFESDLYENAGRPGDSALHDQPWMMRTQDVADAVVFCLTRPADVQVEKLVLTKKMKQ